jgi:hypothetical protein
MHPSLPYQRQIGVDEAACRRDAGVLAISGGIPILHDIAMCNTTSAHILPEIGYKVGFVSWWAPGNSAPCPAAGIEGFRPPKRYASTISL